MSIKLNENEKSRILKMHNDYKKSLIGEQTQDTKSQLEAMIARGCITNGTVVELNSPKTPEKFAIKKPNKSGTAFRYFLINGDVFRFDTTTKKFEKEMTWDVNACRTKESKKEDQMKTAQEIKQEGWLTQREAEAQGIIIANAQKTTFNGVQYYKPYGQQTVTSAAPGQAKLISALNDLYGDQFSFAKNKDSEPDDFGWAFEGDGPVYAQPEWQTADIPANLQRLNLQGQKILLNPKNVKSTRTNAQLSRQMTTASTSVDNESCKKAILDYYEQYQQSTPTDDVNFGILKKQVMQCKARFCSKNQGATGGKCEGKWKLGIGGGSRKMDDIIDFFSEVPGNPIGIIDRARKTYSFKRA